MNDTDDMSRVDDRNSGQRDEENIQRILRAAGKRPALPEATKQVWAETFRGELNQVVAKRRLHRRTVVGAICASGLLLAVFLGISLPDVEPLATAQVTRSIGSSYGFVAQRGRYQLEQGTPLENGAILETSRASILAISYRQSSVRLNENTRVRILEDYIELLTGQLYVGTGAYPQPSARVITIKTPLAKIRDIGTQFTVSYTKGAVIAQVRDGTIVVDVSGEEHQADAQLDFAQRIQVSDKQQVRRSQVSRRGDDWDWILAVSTAFALEGRTTHEFLVWSVGETGMKLIYDTPEAEASARNTVLHGDASSLTPADSIDAVLRTTQLYADYSEPDNLRIRLAKR